MTHEFYGGRGNPARDLAQQLDSGNGREVANVLQNIYQTDRYAFSQLAQQINRVERNNTGDDLTITENGQVFVGDHHHQERVGQLENFSNGRGYNDRNHSRGGFDRHNNGGSRVDIDIDIDISPAPYPRNGSWGNGRNNWPNEPIYRPYPPISRHPEPVYYPDGDYGGYDRHRQNDRNIGIHSRSRSGNDAEVFGTIIGGVAGGVIGHQRDRDDTLTGTLIGALGGNIIGRQIDGSNNRQRDYRWQR